MQKRGRNPNTTGQEQLCGGVASRRERETGIPTDGFTQGAFVSLYQANAMFANRANGRCCPAAKLIFLLPLSSLRNMLLSWPGQMRHWVCQRIAVLAQTAAMK